MIPEDLKFTEDHEWVRFEGDEAVVGITDYAQEELGDITFIELPATGASFKQKDVVSAIESVKAASEIFAPLSGEITAVNDTLEDKPELINESPYDKGWIFQIRISNAGEKDSLLSAKKYAAFLEGLED